MREITFAHVSRRHSMMRLKIFLVVLCLGWGLFPDSSVQAGVNVWTSLGPEGGAVLALAIDPRSPSTLYAGTRSGGVFKSTNGGASWSAVNTGLLTILPDNSPPGTVTVTVSALAIDPLLPSTEYAAVGGTVFKST